MRAGGRRRLGRALFSIFRIRALEGLQYRLAGLAGAATGIFWCLIEITVYIVFFTYADRAGIAGIANGLTLAQVITYSWLAQVLFTLQPNSVSGEILTMIDKGDVGVELCRPLPLYSHWYAKNAADSCVRVMWRGAFTLLAGILMPGGLGMLPPASWAGLGCALLSLLSAFLLCAAFGTFMCAVRLNVKWGNGPMYIIALGSMVLSGTYLPLQLWPQALQGFLLFQPFAGYLDIPVRLYLGVLLPGDALWALTLQLGWTAFFILLGRLVMARRLKRIVVQGG